MEAFYNFYKFLDATIIRGIFAGILIIIILKYIFKTLETTKTSNIISWILISFAFLSLFGTIVLLIIDEYVRDGMLKRATGKYWWAFWLMTISRLFIPLLLLKSQNRKKLFLILIISITMYIGWLFESIAINFLNFADDLIKICPGIILGLILLAVENMRKNIKIKGIQQQN